MQKPSITQSFACGICIFLHSLPYINSFPLSQTFPPVSVLKQKEQPAEQKALASQVMSKASRTVPVSGEMWQETWLLGAGATVTTGAVGSTTGIWKVYLAKAGSFCPAKNERKHIVVKLWLLICKECISPVHRHYQRTIGDHGDIL